MTPLELAKACAAVADEKKSEDIVILDLREVSGFTDYFVVCSVGSEPQLKAVVGALREKMKEAWGIRPVAVDGFPASHWVVVDFGAVVAHLFHAGKRQYYRLEDLWGDAPRVPWP